MNDNAITLTVNNDLQEKAKVVLESVGELIKKKCSEGIMNDELTELSNIVGAYDSLYQSICSNASENLSIADRINLATSDFCDGTVSINLDGKTVARTIIRDAR